MHLKDLIKTDPLTGASFMQPEVLSAIWRVFSAYRRCYDALGREYHRYGGRGIKISDEFLDPGTFVEYLMQLPGFGQPGLSLDRADNARGYERGNLRWATALEQAANKDPISTQKYKQPEPGDVYGKLTIISLSKPPPGRSGKFFRCRCACGAEHTVRSVQLLSGRATRCRDCAIREIAEARHASAAVRVTPKIPTNILRMINHIRPLRPVYGFKGRCRFFRYEPLVTWVKEQPAYGKPGAVVVWLDRSKEPGPDTCVVAVKHGNLRKHVILYKDGAYSPIAFAKEVLGNASFVTVARLAAVGKTGEQIIEALKSGLTDVATVTPPPVPEAEKTPSAEFTNKVNYFTPIPSTAAGGKLVCRCRRCGSLVKQAVFLFNSGPDRGARLRNCVTCFNEWQKTGKDPVIKKEHCHG